MTQAQFAETHPAEWAQINQFTAKTQQLAALEEDIRASQQERRRLKQWIEEHRAPVRELLRAD